MVPGEEIGSKYKILRIIGLRGTRKRFVGEDLVSKNKVIIETLHESLTQNQLANNEIAYEVQLAEKLNGPYFKEFIEAIVQENNTYLVWKYNDAQPLSRNLSLAELTPRDICRFIGTTITALTTAHKKGIIHGALSTDVILITPDLEPVIIGFSIPGVEPITDPGIEEGLSAYHACAPELFTGEPIDESCDYYAVGKIAQYLLSLVDQKINIQHGNITNSDKSVNLEPPEIQRARDLILGLTSTIREFRLETATKIADPSFLDEMSTPPGGTLAVNISKRESRKIRKQLKPGRKPISERTRFLGAIGLKALGIVGAALGIILLVAKLTQQN